MTVDRKTGHNSRLPQWGLTWLNQALCFYQSFCLVDSEVLRNPPLRQAAKRYLQPKKTTTMTRKYFKIKKIYLPNAHMAHLVMTDTKAGPSQNKKNHFPKAMTKKI